MTIFKGYLSDHSKVAQVALNRSPIDGLMATVKGRDIGIYVSLTHNPARGADSIFVHLTRGQKCGALIQNLGSYYINTGVLERFDTRYV